jgi:cell division protein FtsZ
VKTIMARMGYAVMGTATANGSRRAIEAAQKAIASPLLEAGAIDGARGILINITGSASLKLAEVQEACSIIQNAADDDANIIFGAVLDEKMKDAVKITVIATGFRDEDRPRRRTESSGFTVNAGADDFDSIPETPRMVMESHEETRASSREQSSGSSFPGAPLLPDVGRSGIQDGVAVDSMRDAMIANFEQADLDVPAFLRKRGETM